MQELVGAWVRVCFVGDLYLKKVSFLPCQSSEECTTAGILFIEAQHMHPFLRASVLCASPEQWSLCVTAGEEDYFGQGEGLVQRVAVGIKTMQAIQPCSFVVG
jgi:hypothetical protein